MTEEKQKCFKILVLGSGIIGLSSAVTIQEYFKPKQTSLPEKGIFDLNWQLHHFLGHQLDWEKLGKTKVEVTILAEKFPPETTSYQAGGVWGPHSLPEDDIEIIKYFLFFLNNINLFSNVSFYFS